MSQKIYCTTLRVDVKDEYLYLFRLCFPTMQVVFLFELLFVILIIPRVSMIPASYILFGNACVEPVVTGALRLIFCLLAKNEFLIKYGAVKNYIVLQKIPNYLCERLF